MRTPARILIVLMLLTGVAACSDDDKEDAKDTVTSLQDEAADEVGEAGARGAAEALRAALLAEDLGDDESLRSVELLEDRSGDLPGDPEISGIEDGDGDGLDDDGDVQITVSDKSACVSISTSDEVEATDSTC